MEKSIIKKVTYLAIFLVLIFYASRAFVWAEDDEVDDDEEYSNTTKTTSTSASTDTKTVTTTKVETFKDSDGDGLLDKDDPHPKIAEIYIVEDNNANGIVDKFEKKNE